MARARVSCVLVKVSSINELQSELYLPPPAVQRGAWWDMSPDLSRCPENIGHGLHWSERGPDEIAVPGEPLSVAVARQKLVVGLFE